jgi:3-dehydroquinate synthase
LAQVDSSVGGKTAVNLPSGKNLFGAFWQPGLVVIDTDTLGSLADRDYVEGLAEVVKYGIIRDTVLFDWLEASRVQLLERNAEALAHLVARCCEIKAAVVAEDERESGVRAILNYGHTFGHAIEAVCGYGVLRHGEAVAIGMVIAARVAVGLEMLPGSDAARIERLIAGYGLPVRLPEGTDVAGVVAAFSRDKKALGGVPRFVLPEAIGRVRILKDVDPGVIRECIESLRA